MYLDTDITAAVFPGPQPKAPCVNLQAKLLKVVAKFSVRQMRPQSPFNNKTGG